VFISRTPREKTCAVRLRDKNEKGTGVGKSLLPIQTGAVAGTLRRKGPKRKYFGGGQRERAKSLYSVGLRLKQRVASAPERGSQGVSKRKGGGGKKIVSGPAECEGYGVNFIETTNYPVVW